MSEIVDGKGRFYSRSENGIIEYFLDEDGMPTTEYPHVHVIHHEKNDRCEVICSESKNDHPHREELQGNDIGQQVQSAIQSAIKYLFG